MSVTQDRFGVRLAAPSGLGPRGVEEIATVLSPMTGRPADELSKALAAGPIVVHTHITEADARQLVTAFRALGARAELIEAVDLTPATGAGASTTRPLFAISETGQIDKAWRHVTTGGRPAVNVEAGPAPPKTQPFRSVSDILPLGLAKGLPGVVPPASPGSVPPPTSQMGVFPGAPAGAVFRPQSSRAPAPVSEPPGPAPGDTQPIAIAASVPATAGPDRAAPPNNLSTVRFDAVDLERVLPDRAAGATQPVSTVGVATAVESRTLLDTAKTRPFQRHDAGGGADATSAGSPRTNPPRAPSAVSGPDATAAHNLELLDTGAIETVQAGPRIFQLSAPEVRLTETGHMPVQARLDPPTESSMRLDLQGSAQAPPAGPQPADFPTDAPRPGVYKLPSRTGNRAAPANAPAPPAALPPAGLRPAPNPAGTSPVAARATLDTAGGSKARAAPAGEHAPGTPPRIFSPGDPPVDAGRRPSTARGAPPSFSPPGQSARSAAAAEAADHHSPGTAAWMSVLVPGLGQVYNGQRERGILVALGTPLVIPYVYGIYDAFRTAQAISQRKYAPPDATSRATAYIGQLALGLVVMLGIGVLALVIHRRSSAPAPAPVAATPRTAVAPPALAAAAPATSRAPRVPLGDALDVPALMKKGRMACNQGLFNECEEIMHEVIAREPANRNAFNLLVEATQQRKVKPTPASSPP